MERDGYYKIEYIKSIIKRNFNITISDLDIWSEYRNGNIKTCIKNGEVYFDLYALLSIYNPKKGAQRTLKERVRDSVVKNYCLWWGKPIGDYDINSDWLITEDELIQYNTNRVLNNPLFKKEKKDE